MHSWEAIDTSIQYIEEHCAEELPTRLLADLVGLSPFYFQRLFKRLVGRSVQEYIGLRRLAGSLGLLDDPKKSILEVALDSGYLSHSGYTRAFRACYGMTPQQYRANRPTLNSFIKPELSIRYAGADEGVPLIAGSMVLEIERRILECQEFYLGVEAEVPVSGQIPAGEKTGIDIPGELWKQFHSVREVQDRLSLNGVELGVSHTPNPQMDTFLYFAGGQTDSAAEYAGMKRFVLSPGEYVICRIESDSWEHLVTDALYQANKYLYETWLANRSLSVLPFAAEKYYPSREGIYGMELWVKTEE